MTKKVIIKSIDRKIGQSNRFVEYEYSPVREGIQTIQMACLAHENLKFKISKIKIKKATLIFTGTEDAIDALFTMLALTDFADKYTWRFCFFH